MKKSANSTDKRRPAAQQASFAVAELSDRWSPGQYTVTTCTEQPRTYRTVYHGPGSEHNYCECMDFRTNGLGSCKHIEAVAQWLESTGKEAVTKLPRRPAIFMSYIDGRRLKLYPGADAPAELMLAAMRYFDDDLTAVPGMVAELPAFVELARRIDPQFHCYPDALNYILDERDRRRRLAMLEELSDADFDKLLATPLYRYQRAGIRFAFGAGRALIADEMGLGKAVQAIGTAELMRHKKLIYTVLILCPTALKYQWQSELKRYTGIDATIVEGATADRHALLREEVPYKIVSYHTLANDIRALGTLQADCLIMDQAQRLQDWNPQIAQAVRRIESDYAVVLSGTPPEKDPDVLRALMQFVGYRHRDEIAERLKDCLLRRSKAAVAAELPARTNKTLLVPMTKEQRAVYDDSRQTLSRLLRKWQRLSFLSERDRKRLLLMLSRMRMVCDSTFVVDQNTRFDTKVAEAVQLVRQMLANSDSDKAVILSQWERMTRIVGEELERAGISYEYLHGGIQPSRRRAIAEAFNRSPQARVLLASDAGATGLYLPSATLLINLDLAWSRAASEQRTARILSPNPQHKVQIINMIATNTIEERIALATPDTGLPDDISDSRQDCLFLDDDALNRLTDALLHIIPEDSDLQL